MEKSWFFDNGEQYGQAELSEYFRQIYRSGVSVSDAGLMDMEVSANGTQVSVGNGFAIINGFAYENSGTLSFTIESDNNYSRIDRVVLRLDLALMKISAEIKKGTAGSTPKAPDLQRDSMVYELSLARVLVDVNGNITVTDERTDVELCGAIRPRNLSEIDAMIQGFQKQFESWFNAQQALGWRNIYIQEETPTEAVTGSLWL